MNQPGLEKVVLPAPPIVVPAADGAFPKMERRQPALLPSGRRRRNGLAAARHAEVRRRMRALARAAGSH